MNGLIAFFDILGYQSFLNNNTEMQHTSTIRKVLELVRSTPETIDGIRQATKIIAQKQDPDSKGIQSVVFSDTIIIWFKYPPNADDNIKMKYLGWLSFTSAVLFREMFSKGLPLRGAIVEGEFEVMEMSFAGKAVSDAHKLASELNFSGIVYSSNIIQTKNPFCVPYLSPLKTTERPLNQLNWFLILEDSVANELLKDIELAILESFWMHNKDCNMAVDEKVRNTAKLIRKFAIECKLKKKREQSALTPPPAASAPQS